MLSLDLTNPGFDASVLCEFRQRLLEGKAEQQILQPLLNLALAHGWLKARGKQRTDSTHVFGAIRTLHRLETVGETMRATLNVLATVAPEWLRMQVSEAWIDRYEKRFEGYRLPKGKAARFSTKREVLWAGYKVHLTETCDKELPHLITHVETTPATTYDGAVTVTIHEALEAIALPPEEHIVDSG